MTKTDEKTKKHIDDEKNITNINVSDRDDGDQHEP